MGTHCNNPSYDYETKRSLEDFIKDNHMLMGHDVVDKYGEKLPFLFKVLSARKALSIQAHPNKKLAKELHEKNPKEYKDDNHKPEMTIAITPFEGLCGFRPLEEVSYFLKAVKSFRKLVGEDAAAQFEATVDDGSKSEAELKQALKDAFSSLMNAKEEDVKAAVEELLAQIKKEDQHFTGGESTPTPGSKAFAELLPRLNGQFPNDIGLFVVFFLNYVELQPGEAMFLQADDIHAYISGGTYPLHSITPPPLLTTTPTDIMECMASSDNVVRAGFTPKFKDVPTLTGMLTYNFAPISEQKMSPSDFPYCKFNTTAHSSGSSAQLYDPPIEEFAVVKTDLNSSGSKVTFEGIEGPSIVICTEGHGTIGVGPKSEEIREGWVFFVGATAEVVLESSSGDTPFRTFRAFCEIGDEKTSSGGKL